MPRTRSAGAFEPLEPRTLLAAQFVADLNTAPASSNPEQSLRVNGLTYFVADDGLHGREVWRTDGTPAGTQLVRDVVPGPEGGFPVLLGAAGNRVYFQVNGIPWQTDPATGDTSPLFRASGAYFVGMVYPPAVTAVFNGDLYAVAQNGLFQFHDDAYYQISDLGGYVNDAKIAATPSHLYVLTRETGLWVSDGTSQNTLLLTPALPSYNQGTTTDLVALGDTAIFTAENALDQTFEVWKTQGTEDTTSLLATTTQFGPSTPLAAAGGNVYFWIRNPQNYAFDLWKSDGTPDGTAAVRLVTDTGYNYLPPTLLTSGSKVFFTTQLAFGSGQALWASDGTHDGTAPVRDDLFLPPPQAADTSVFAANDAVYFLAGTSASPDLKVWTTTDGTPATTRAIGTLPQASDGTLPNLIGVVGNRPLLAHTDAQHAREPWIANTTNTSIALLKDLNTATADAIAGRPVSLNGRLLVPTEQELWLFPTPTSAPQRLTVGAGGRLVGRTGAVARVGNQAFFTAFVTGINGPQLLVTDGTAAGTRIVTSIAGGVLPYQGFAVGNRFYFNSGYTGAETFNVSDGTAAGTRALVSGFTIAYSADYRQRAYTLFKGRLYFPVRAGSGSAEQLWSTDGTPAGTAAVTPSTFPSPGQAFAFTPVGDRLYFLWGNRLYRTDGTAAGTVAMGTAQYSRIEPTDDGGLLLLQYSSAPVMKLAPGSDTPAPLLANLTSGYESARVGKWVYFNAGRLGTYGIWRTDGTAANTTLVFANSQPMNFTPAAGALYLTASSGGSGREVYVIDPASTGARLVADVVPGEGSSLPGGLVDAGGNLYFHANDGVHGYELWRATDDVAPAAFNPTFNPAANAVSVTLPFTENVAAASLTLSDFKLTNRATNADVSNLLASVTFDPNTFVATLTFTTAFAKGDYRLTLPAGAAADPAGNVTAAATTLDFFHLPGDINSDRAVNFDDLLLLAKNYNKTAATYTQGDLTGDGTVNFDDLLILAKNYNAALPNLPLALTTAQVSPATAPVLAATRTQTPAKPTPVFSTTPVPSKRPPAPAKPPARKPR